MCANWWVCTISSGCLKEADATTHMNKPSMRTWRWRNPAGYIGYLLESGIASRIDALELKPDAQILDYGCGESPYRRFCPQDCHYIGADLPGNPAADVEIGEDGRLSLDDASCDLVLSTQVLEHVADPSVYLQECRRILKPGGTLILTTHGLMFRHPVPRDLWRWTLDGLKLLVEQQELEVMDEEGLMGLSPTALWLILCNLMGKLPRGLRRITVIAFNLLIYASDRLTSDDSRRDNACVFALVVKRP